MKPEGKIKRGTVWGTPEFHWTNFPEFIRWETAAGGPDPHIKLASDLARSSPDPAWFVGCYIAPYNVPSAEFIYNAWPSSGQVLYNADAFGEFIRLSFDAIAFRQERRAVMGPDKFIQHMLDYAKWINEDLGELDADADFDKAFEVTRRIQFNGRYGTMKTYETIRRVMNLKSEAQCDIRARDGWSPRWTLSLLRPEYADVLNDKSKDSIIDSEAVAELVKKRLQDEFGIMLTWYDFETLLCNYRQLYGGKYPGRSHDSELKYGNKLIAKRPGYELRQWEARKRLFHRVLLGEHMGWDGGRKDVAQVINDHGYVWSDLIYDYMSSKDDLGNPVRWP